MSDGSLIHALRRAANQAIRAGEFEAADRVVARLEAADPRSLETRGLRLEVHLRTGRAAEARALLMHLLEHHSDSPRLQMLAGRFHYGEREYAEALHHLQESERLHSSSWTRRFVGRTLTQLGRFDEAEATLLGVVTNIPAARRELAWLYERRRDDARALAECERYLELAPEDTLARAQRRRLRARELSPEDLGEEVEGMLALGEDVAPEVVPEYVEGLFKTGEAARARAFVAKHAERWDDRVRTSVAWVTYRHQAFDVAFDLFATVFDLHRKNPKFINSFEAAARRADRIARAIALYERHAPSDPRLHGRIKRLSKELPPS